MRRRVSAETPAAAFCGRKKSSIFGEGDSKGIAGHVGRSSASLVDCTFGAASTAGAFRGESTEAAVGNLGLRTGKGGGIGFASVIPEANGEVGVDRV